jgi:glycerophosphoryl diester phosphodiesterase
MLVLSHRGYHVTVPENTSEAFERALRLGVDGIETDLQISADGHLILFHNRLAPDGRATGALRRDELSALVGYPIPTLEEVLQQYPGVLWNIEIKTPAVLAPAVAILRQFCRTRRLLITSFWHTVIEDISQRLDVDCGIVVAHRPFARAVPPFGWWPETGRVQTVVWAYPIVDAEIVAQTARQGRRNFIYGVETAQDRVHCAALQVDGVITDHPDLWLPTRPD